MATNRNFEVISDRLQNICNSVIHSHFVLQLNEYYNQQGTSMWDNC